MVQAGRCGNRAWAVSLLSTSVTSCGTWTVRSILNGAMGVKKLKEHADGTVTQLQRFITNLVPMNSYLRRLRGDSGLLPPLVGSG